MNTTLFIALAALQLSKAQPQVDPPDDPGNIEVVLRAGGHGLAFKDAAGGGTVYFWLGIRNVSAGDIILSELTSVGVTLMNESNSLASILTTGMAHCTGGNGNHLILPGETYFVLVPLKIKKRDLAATAVEAHASVLEARSPGECGTTSRRGKVRLALKFEGPNVVLSPAPGY